MQKYQLTEIFYSLQGEGFWTGSPAIFIRFAGCNLKCPWCDTDHRKKLDLNADQILVILRKWKCGMVVLTGGEPLLQIDSILLAKLKAAGFRIHVESNGSIPADFGTPIDWLTISPKFEDRWIQKKGQELKVIYTNQDLDQYFSRGVEFDHRFLQPLSNQNVPQTTKKVMENPEWRLSLQTQKLLKIR